MSQTIPYILQVLAPASEPITLAEAKLYLRIDSTDEDEVITRLIATARNAAEHYLRRSLITQTWKMAYEGYAPARTTLMRGPVQSISAVKIIARDGAETVLDSSAYYLTTDKSILCFDMSALGHVVEIEYLAGFGDALAVPAAIKQGMLMHIAQMFDNRDASVLGVHSRSLYDAYRLVAI